MEALTALASGLVLASLSGITALAFKHPEAFAKLYPFLNLGVSIVFLSLSIWQVAVHITWAGLLPFVSHEQLQGAYLIKQNLALPYAWICIILTALLVFFWVNVKLPVFIKSVGTKPN
jgi:hypothetical protein